MRWERARQPEQKEQRRQAILEAAGALFDEGGLEAASLSAIGRRAALSKANLYRYFQSREAILLELLLEEVEVWVTHLEGALAPLAGQSDVEAVVDRVVRSLVQHPRVCGLSAVVSTVLEHNVTAEGVLPFKRRTAQLLVRAGNALHAALPTLGPPRVRRFVTYLTLVMGQAWSAAHPPREVAAVLAREDCAALAVSFEHTLQDCARLLLRGLLAEASGDGPAA